MSIKKRCGESSFNIACLFASLMFTALLDHFSLLTVIKLMRSFVIGSLPSFSVSSEFPAGKAARVTTLPAKISGDQRLRYRCL